MIREDLNVFFSDLAVSAEWTPPSGGASLSAQVLFDEPSEQVLGDALVIASVATITYATGTLPGLDEGDVLTVDGHSYRVRELPKRNGDGRVTRALISRN